MEKSPSTPKLSNSQSQMVERLKILYPNVDPEILPKTWSTDSKNSSIHVNSYRVHYKGKDFTVQA